MRDPQTARLPISALTIGALGVVFGDIGTSPLYTIKEVFGSSTGVPLDASHLLGASSTIFWSLMMIVTIKYVMLILRADNHGEGGIMALTALASNTARKASRRRSVLLMLGLFGAALFYGDSVITPAISVLSAVEGLELATPAFKPYVLPVSVAVIVVLFLVQKFGTTAVGKLFGPVMVGWFALLGITGVIQIQQHPAILAALDPRHAISFLAERGWGLFPAMGAIVLALTGAEALYADMGHFGKLPIRIAWLGLVLPMLTLNYLGQCAMLTDHPEAIDNPFFRMFPAWATVAVVALSALATVIASQAVISGAYSMTKEAIQLGFLPRMRIEHTSAREIGQVYIPVVNRILLVAVLLATIGFGSSTALASAYGIAVTTTMLITTMLTFFVIRYQFRMSLLTALVPTAFFLVLDAILVASCSLKFVEGGWFPLLIGAGLFVLMATWHRGQTFLAQRAASSDPDLEPFVASIAEERIARVPGVAVFPVSSDKTVPLALLHNLKHNHVIHETNVVAVLQVLEIPFVPLDSAVTFEKLAPGFWRMRYSYGFKDVADLPAALSICAGRGLVAPPMETSYFISRAEVAPQALPSPSMAKWRLTLFTALARNAGSAAEYLKLPNNAIVVLRARVQI